MGWLLCKIHHKAVTWDKSPWRDYWHIIVVYFNQQMGALHAVCWSKSFFWLGCTVLSHEHSFDTFTTFTKIVKSIKMLKWKSCVTNFFNSKYAKKLWLQDFHPMLQLYGVFLHNSWFLLTVLLLNSQIFLDNEFWNKFENFSELWRPICTCKSNSQIKIVWRIWSSIANIQG